MSPLLFGLFFDRVVAYVDSLLPLDGEHDVLSIATLLI